MQFTSRNCCWFIEAALQALRPPRPSGRDFFGMCAMTDRDTSLDRGGDAEIRHLWLASAIDESFPTVNRPRLVPIHRALSAWKMTLPPCRIVRKFIAGMAPQAGSAAAVISS
jgi:hypothetical protein